VPEGQELCVTDILWIMNGPPNESLTLALNIVAVFPQGLSGAGFTLYGKQRPASSSPCS
jgi:hypothetical protein